MAAPRPKLSLVIALLVSHVGPSERPLTNTTNAHFRPTRAIRVRTNEWLLPQVQQPAGVAVGSSDANVSARNARVATPLHSAALTNQPVVINTL